MKPEYGYGGGDGFWGLMVERLFGKGEGKGV